MIHPNLIYCVINVSMANYSIIEYFGESNDGKCGYCKKTGNYNSHGFWAHTLNVTDYQELINRNWRRSGQYCYRPKNADTCCPMYTIKCDALNFKLNKSHKKILKRMNKFLRDGIKDKDDVNMHDAGAGGAQEPKPSKHHSDVNIDGINVSSLNRGNDSKVNALSHLKTEANDAVDGQVQEKKKSVAALSSDCDKPSNPKKAKLIRLERKKEKLAAKGLKMEDVVVRKLGNVEKSLEEFLAEEPMDGKHRLQVRVVEVKLRLKSTRKSFQVKLVPSTDGSDKIIFNLYKKYQMRVHNDPPEKLSTRSYERFLVNSPLQVNIAQITFNYFFSLFLSLTKNRKKDKISVGQCRRRFQH